MVSIVRNGFTAGTHTVLPSLGEIPSAFRVLLFTGHMIDQEDRTPPRFPPDKEPAARDAIRAAVHAELYNMHRLHSNGHSDLPIIGIAGGACGGDILFHEACLDFGIRGYMFLLFPRDQFVATSVAFAGEDWVRRFDLLYRTLNNDGRVLTQDSPSHVPFSDDPSHTIWQRNNSWMLDNALAYGGHRMTLISLWNGEVGHELGGTADMIQQAETEGANTLHIDTNEIFGGAPVLNQ